MVYECLSGNMENDLMAFIHLASGRVLPDGRHTLLLWSEVVSEIMEDPHGKMAPLKGRMMRNQGIFRAYNNFRQVLGLNGQNSTLKKDSIPPKNGFV